ncbi:MAG TPA: hypothetical protein VFM75_05810 [Modicisalibacter sp.]|nr:hypothetical protein [Modicisalibacter sp.]
MKKFLALLTLPLALQACGSMDYQPKVSVADQDAVIEAIRQDNAEVAMYLETLQAQHAQGSNLFESVFNLALAGAAFAHPASGVASGVSVLLALGGMQGLDGTPQRPLTIVYQSKEAPEERSGIATLMAYRQAVADLSEYDGDLAQILLAHYASESGMSELHAALTEGPSSSAGLQGMCMGLAALGSQAETIYDSLKVPANLAGAAPPIQDEELTSAKPLQASR